MGMAAAESPSTCTSCGAETREGFGCMVCLLRVGLDDTLGDENGASVLRALPDQFGHYTIATHPDGSVWELGRGAMGVTFRALDTSLDRPVALKILHTETLIRGAGARERFMREARAAGALRHPNIATVYHFGIREETGQCFYAMELVEGETLEARVRRTGPIDPPSALKIAQQIAEALAVAEMRGLVHRDLKPSNIMIVDGPQESSSRDLTVKVIDFGLAKALTDQADPMSVTRNGFIGTPAFASPEQFAHNPIDTRSDIYSLGATLWFLLTGRTIFSGQTVEEIRDKQGAAPLPVERLKAARVPSRMISLIVSMLALEPAARPGTRELAARIERCRSRTATRGRRLALAAGVIASIVIAALLIVREVSNRRSPPAASPSQTSIAVLPFENLSRDPDAAYFVNGIREQIAVRLAKIGNLKLVSANSSHHYQTAPENIGQLATDLGVANVLQGSVEKANERLRVVMRLTDVRKNRQVWTQSYERTFGDISKIESEAAGQIATALGLKLTQPEEGAIKRIPTSNPRAYEAYLKGRYVWIRRTFDGYGQAKEYFEQAIALDPNYAQAHAGLADASQFLAAFSPYSRKERYDKAKAEYKRALELDPMLAEAHASAGLVAMNYDWDWALAEEEFRRAIALDPNNALTYDWYAEYLMAVGRTSESLSQIERARQLDPFSLIINSDAGKMLFYARLYDAAEGQLKETLRMNPDFGQAGNWLAQVYATTNRFDEAIACFQGVGQSQEGPWGLGFTAFIYGMAGKKAEAKQTLEALQKRLPAAPQPDKLALALAYIGVGDKDRAFACLEEDYQAHATTMTSLKSSPWYDSLRSDPRFTDLMRRVHLVP